MQQVGTSPLAEIPGVDKSAVYKINPDDTVETLWSSKEENVYSLVARSAAPGAKQSGDSLYFATDAQGRLYRLGADRKATLMVETNEGEATRLLESPDGLVAATGDMGKLFRLADAAGASGSYESPVHDSGSVARWGRISWRVTTGSPSAKVQVATRAGNSARPDKTWSDWSEPLSDAQNSLIRSPNARYIQWRASLEGPGAAIENVSLAYLPQNNPPVIRSISVSSQSSAQKSAAGQQFHLRGLQHHRHRYGRNVYACRYTDADAYAWLRIANSSDVASRRPGWRPVALLALFSRRR